jgi:tight adherence protein C
MINSIVLGVAVIISVMVGVIVYDMATSKTLKNTLNSTEKGIANMTKGLKGTREQDLYSEIEQFLIKNGIYFMSNGKVSTEKFILFQLLTVILMIIVCMRLNQKLIILAIPAGIIIPIAIVKLSNSQDNDKMQGDIERCINTMAIEIKHGVHVQDLVFDLFMQVKNRRLKKAILELAANINIDAQNVVVYIEEFKSKFNEEQIEQIGDLILQSVNQENTDKIVDAVKFRLGVIQSEKEARERKRTERITSSMNILIYLVILIFILQSIMQAIYSVM